jgi:hypothetical protein
VDNRTFRCQLFLSFGRKTVESCERLLDAPSAQSFDDEHQSSAYVTVGPPIKMRGWMNRVLYAMDHHWAQDAGNLQHAFYPKDVFSVAIDKHGQPEGKCRPV